MKVWAFDTYNGSKEPIGFKTYYAFAETELEAVMNIRCRYNVPSEVELVLLTSFENRRKGGRRDSDQA